MEKESQSKSTKVHFQPLLRDPNRITNPWRFQEWLHSSYLSGELMKKTTKGHSESLSKSERLADQSDIFK